MKSGRITLSIILAFFLLLLASQNSSAGTWNCVGGNCNQDDSDCSHGDFPVFWSVACNPSNGQVVGGSSGGYSMKHTHLHDCGASCCSLEDHEFSYTCNSNQYCDQSAVSSAVQSRYWSFGNWNLGVTSWGSQSNPVQGVITNPNNNLDLLDQFCKRPDESAWVCQNRAYGQFPAQGTCVAGSTLYTSAGVTVCNQNNENQQISTSAGAYTCFQGIWAAGGPAGACASLVGQSGTDNYLTQTGDSNKCCGNNAVRDPEFEGANTALWTSSPAGIFTEDAGVGLDGSNALRVSSLVAGDKYVIQNIDLTPGNYLFTFYARGDLGTGSERRAVDGIFIQERNNFQKALELGPILVTRNWQKYSIIGNVPFNQARIILRSITGTGTGTESANTILYDKVYLLSLDNLSRADVAYITSADGLSNRNNRICTYDDVAGTKQFIWLNALTASEQFKIHPVDNTFDSVSNGQNFTICNPTNAFSIPGSIFAGQTLPAVSGLQGGGNTGGGGGTGGTGQGGTGGGIVPGGNFFGNLGSGGGTAQTGTGQSINFAPKIILENYPINTFTVSGIIGFVGTSVTGLNLTNSTGGQYPATVTSTSSTGFVASLPALQADSYSIKIQTTTNVYVFSSPDKLEVVPSGIPAGGVAISPNASRLICHNEASYGAIDECCGVSYFNCMNQQDTPNQAIYPKAHRAGETLDTLQDFYYSLDPSSNYALQLYFEQNSNDALAFTAPVHTFGQQNLVVTNQLRISDWTGYDALEFDIAFVNDNNVSVYILDNSVFQAGQTQLKDIDLTKALLKVKVRDFTIDPPSLYNWHHVRIPLAAFGLKRKNIGLIFFKENPSEWQGAQPVFISGQNTPKIIYGYDRVFLSRNADTSKPRFCALNFSWTDDLDKDPVACNNVVTSLWTGHKCCGDDQGRGTSFETFNDQIAGCWKGIPIGENQVINITVFNSSVQGIPQQGGTTGQ